MKKFTLIAVLTVVAVLVFAGLAMAAPGNYAPDSTSNYLTVGHADSQLTKQYTDGKGVVRSYVNGDVYFLNPHAKSLTDPRSTVGGWAIFNANYTGALNVPYFKTNVSDPAFHDTFQRNVYGQLVHTNFQLNTNSCASCHMTHTAQSRKLLFRNGVYSTCVACHDGTLGFLNVFAIPGASNKFGGSQTAGTFAANKARNASVHLASDTMTLSAAPGGNRANQAAALDDNTAGTWTTKFNCASCHGPHGSYSIRLLHYNPANIAMRPAITAAQQEANSGGLWFKGASVSFDSVTDGVYKYKAKIGTVVVPRADAPWLYSYAGGATTVSGVRYPRFATRIYYTDFFDPNTTLAYTGNPSHTPGGPMAAVDGTKLLNRFFSIKYGKGYATQDATQRADMLAFIGQSEATFDPAKLKIDVGGLVVVTASTRNMTEITALDATEASLALPQYSRNFIKTTTYTGKYAAAGAAGLTGNAQSNNYSYNLYCAACHTDYLMGAPGGSGLAAQSGSGVGIFSKAYRHTMNRGATGGETMQVRGNGNSLLCVSCHYVHGVDSSFQQLADTTLVDNPTLTKGTDANAVNPYVGANDVNHSSALRRYINMAVCWTCHANSSAATLKNSSWYWDNYDKDDRGKW